MAAEADERVGLYVKFLIDFVSELTTTQYIKQSGSKKQEKAGNLFLTPFPALCDIKCVALP